MRRRLVSVGIVLTGLVVSPIGSACGPVFPTAYLGFDFESEILFMPEASFYHEISVHFASAPLDFEPRELPETYLPPVRRTIETDIQELSQVLTDCGWQERYKTLALEHYRKLREACFPTLDGSSLDRPYDGNGLPLPRQTKGKVRIDDGLLDAIPREFAEYALGALAFHEDRVDDASVHWRNLLALPPEERVHRSVWAAYMLGRLAMDERNPDGSMQEGLGYFQLARDLVGLGFKDSLDLTQQAYQWLALNAAATGELADAMRWYAECLPVDLYRKRNQTVSELKRLAARALKAETVDPALVADPVSRTVVTSYVIANPEKLEFARKWLAAVELLPPDAVVDGADRLAWAAYNAGDMDAARRWVAASPPDAPYGLWVKSKLLLQEGKLDAAVALLKELTRLFQSSETFDVPPYFEAVVPRQEVYSEIGIFQLGRQDYVEALDAFLRSRAWTDAAYVAERVLTTEELKRYIDSVRGDPELTNSAYRPSLWSSEEEKPCSILDRLGHLLARRLANAGKWREAASYMPEQYRQLASSMDDWLKPSQRNETKRDVALRNMQAARTLYEEGLNLVGTEIEPDYKFSEGRLPYGEACERRSSRKVEPAEWGDARVFFYFPDVWDTILTPITSAFLIASEDEVARIRRNAPDPDTRYHYRYMASELMWKTAGLLPDNDLLTAEALYLGGTYIAKRDAGAADKFYKALVRRCQELPIGQEADRERWFPKTSPWGGKVSPATQAGGEPSNAS